MNKMAQEIVDKIHKSKIGLPKREIEKIVQDTIEQLEKEEFVKNEND